VVVLIVAVVMMVVVVVRVLLLGFDYRQVGVLIKAKSKLKQVHCGTCSSIHLAGFDESGDFDNF
jgi:hypothetical protein